MTNGNIANTIWSIAEILRGDYKQSEYGRVVLPFTLLRRLDCMLEKTKEETLRTYEFNKDRPQGFWEALLIEITGYPFYNTSPWTFKGLVKDPNNIRKNIEQFLAAFPAQIFDIFEQYTFHDTLARLEKSELLYQVVQRFSEIDLDPDQLNSMDMSIYYEELIRRFAEMSNETAGEHFTPREVIHLMVDLLFTHDDVILTKPGIVSAIYDPTAGTGGMLSVAEETIKTRNPQARLVLFGQELNPESYAICKSELLIKNQPPTNIVLGNTLTKDGHADKTFDYCLSNPPFGVEWKKIEAEVRNESKRGFEGRFGPGLPRVSDGSLLFLLHLLARMRVPEKGGSRIGIVFNGSPLFTGGAGSGESEIRRYVLEHDLLEAIIALPNDMFYNTGIATYIWILSNRKPVERQKKMQLINATGMYRKLRKSLGFKRNELGPDDIARIVSIYGAFEESPHSKIFETIDFGYRTITIERPLRLNFATLPERIARLQESLSEQKKIDHPEEIIAAVQTISPDTLYTNREGFLADLRQALAQTNIILTEQNLKLVWQSLSERDEKADICFDKKGSPEPDTELRDTENVPLREYVEEYFQREVLPYAPDAWIDSEKIDKIDNKVGIVGYEIPFTRHFYTYAPPRPLEEISHDVQSLSREIMDLLKEVID